jgi:short-chain fatty acids transporter
MVETTCHSDALNSFSDKILRILKGVLPTPFTIALILTLIAFLMAYFFARPSDKNSIEYLGEMLHWWNDGMWNPAMLAFTVQMMLVLVLGHIIAISFPVNRFLDKAVGALCKNGPMAAFSITLLTITVAWFNWGLGLIFGAIFVRKTGEYAAKNNVAVNYGLLGACGYSGLMVWHGGISGSSTSKVAESGHLKSLTAGNPEIADSLPDLITFSDTVFSSTNLWVSLLLLFILPVFMYAVARKTKNEVPVLNFSTSTTKEDNTIHSGAEKVDYYSQSARIIGVLIISISVYLAISARATESFGFITPNWLNLFLLGIGLVVHGSIANFINAGDNAISGAAGILLQFPLYFGVMGLMSSSGLVAQIADVFVELSKTSGNPASTFPFLSFLSASFLNIFIPSGGAQWAVQGPIIVQGAVELGLALPKNILALAYGDQLTNMLQPFWALPLLGITGLKAKEILPYSILLMLIGFFIFSIGLLFL